MGRCAGGGGPQGRAREGGRGAGRRGVFTGEQPAAEGREGGRGPAGGEAEPLDGEKFVGDARPEFARAVDDDGQEEHDVVGHIEGALGGEAPFAAEVTLLAGLGGGRDHRHEIVAVADLAADFLVPGVAAAEFAFVIPDFETGGGEGIAHGACGGAVFGGIADEDGRARQERRCGVAGHETEGKVAPGRGGVKRGGADGGRGTEDGARGTEDGARGWAAKMTEDS